MAWQVEITKIEVRIRDLRETVSGWGAVATPRRTLIGTKATRRCLRVSLDQLYYQHAFKLTHYGRFRDSRRDAGFYGHESAGENAF